MESKKGIANFDQSEPEFLIDVMDRHKDWAVVVCLVGGGQEINTGEAGLKEWFDALQRSFPHWQVHTSNHLNNEVYTNGEDIYSGFQTNQLTENDQLHLSVMLRSFKSERLSDFVEHLLAQDITAAKDLLKQVGDDYPIVVTRNIETAKQWLRSRARGSQSYGIVASSGANRLRPYGLDIKRKIEPAAWFLNDSTDVRSSDFLEDVGTEFDVQGLELDWICVGWDANLRKSNSGWDYHSFKGSKWQKVKKEIAQRYLLNSYRVLLTRARQGMVIFVPLGSELDSSTGEPIDATRQPSFYDPIFYYLQKLGIREI